ncbi:hypothetical protein [Streptomyces sp. NBC_01768]|uniref:hypothetical protein n=1 Tax=Streptomyces sp. NBC_01768 TaxID=2975938 RepID=UPI002DDA7EF7|nr:hypothetical protein [Streptomyces sp. NBC_01768]WSC34037.1 hypothetical protein OG902_46735 [Streptomyces sp. NBC_01768]
MSDLNKPAPEPDVPPLHTIPDTQRVPPPRRPAPPRPTPLRTVEDLPDGVIIALGVVFIGCIIAALITGVPELSAWARHHDWSWATQWAATVTDPVHAYLDAHTVGLPITATTVFGIWLVVGAATLIGAWIIEGFGPRLTWLAYGTATVFMVWDASPAAGRTVAAGLAVIAWTILSTFAMRGFSLRPVVNVFHRS